MHRETNRLRVKHRTAVDEYSADACCGTCGLRACMCEEDDAAAWRMMVGVWLVGLAALLECLVAR